MIRTNEEAHANLADALWWLRGLAAAGNDNEAKDLANKLLDVRQWLDRITEGRVRRLGEERVVVLTFAEFERLLDAFPTDSDPAPAEIGHAREAIRNVLAEYQRESRAARELPEIPF